MAPMPAPPIFEPIPPRLDRARAMGVPVDA